MLIPLAQLLVKVPSAKVKINSMSMELWDSTGWVIIEGEVVLEDGESTSSLTNVTIPVALSKKELLELFSVVQTNKVPTRTRRRRKS